MVRTSKKGGSLISNPMNSNLINIMSILIFMGPYILVSFFVLLSVFMVNLKGIIYFAGIGILTSILSVISPYLNEPGLGAMCNLFGSKFNIPTSGLNSGIYSFTLVYLFISMFFYNIMNIPIFVVLLSIYCLDVMFNLKFGCVQMKTIMLSTAIGACVGLGWSFVAKGLGMNYYSEYVSDKIACSMPKKQHYKCTMYHNGELVTTFEQGHNHEINSTDITDKFETEQGDKLVRKA